MHLQIINPLEYPDWDELLLTNKNYSFFLSSSWARVLYETYKYEPLYFSSLENGKLSALIPVMDVNSSLTGRRGVSLPFTDYCPLIIKDKRNFQEIIENIIAYGQRGGWKYIEWRGGENHFQDMTPSSSYYSHTLELSQNEQEILSSFRGSTRRNIRKAIKEGVHLEICNSLESVRAFYRLNCATRKSHGLPPQPFYFFRKVFEHIISKKKGFVVLASYHKRNIASAIYFHFGKKAIYKYGASERSYQHLRANNLVMWEAMKWYAQNGFRRFSFGRTDPENKGLLQFKQGWGTNEETINYYRYDLTKDVFVEDSNRVKTSYDLLRKLPSPLLKLVGSLLYKHLG